MSASRQVFELARRDFVQRAKSKAFLMAMALTVGIILIIGPLLSLANREPDPSVVALVGELPPGAISLIEIEADRLAVDLELMTYADIDTAEEGIVAGDIAAAIDGNQLVLAEEGQVRLAAALSGGLSAAYREVRATEMGLTIQEVDTLLYPMVFEQRTLTPAETEEDRAREAGALIGLLLLYISILMFGQFVMMGVMEEKQTRVVEVVLSRVKPAQILIGKVVGIGLLGLIQIVALGAAVVFTLSVIDVADIDLAGIGGKVLAILILWYLLGYAFYSVMYGALGATISRQEDMQGVAMIPVLLILPGFFLAQLAIVSPDGWMAQVASFLPIWSPMVMAVRSTVSNVPLWQVATSIALILATTWALIRLGGRIYRGAILHSGSKTKLRTAWRSAD
jgi:ABC-2 type transport system permease protein